MVGLLCVQVAQFRPYKEYCVKSAKFWRSDPYFNRFGSDLFYLGSYFYVIASDEEAKTAGRDKIIYGIIGLAVIIAVWGLVKILTNTFGLNNTQNIVYPTVPY